MLILELMSGGPLEVNINLGDFVKSSRSIHSMLQRKSATYILNPSVHKHTLRTQICKNKTFLCHGSRHSRHSLRITTACPTHSWPEYTSKGPPAYEE